MAEKIHSGALTLLTEALAIAGSLEQNTELDSRFVQPGLDVGGIAAASQPGLTDHGTFWASWVNTHPGTGKIATNFNLYAPTLAANLGALGEVLKLTAQFDIWAHFAACTIDSSGDGIVASLWYQIDTSTPTMGTTSTSHALVAMWDEFFDTNSGGADDAAQGAGGAAQRISMRIPRSGTGMRFVTNASAATVFECRMLCEFVPKGLRPSVF